LGLKEEKKMLHTILEKIMSIGSIFSKLLELLKFLFPKKTEKEKTMEEMADEWKEEKELGDAIKKAKDSDTGPLNDIINR